MTQQYIGEFSALLGELQPPPGERLAAAVHALRREVELVFARDAPKARR